MNQIQNIPELVWIIFQIWPICAISVTYVSPVEGIAALKNVFLIHGHVRSLVFAEDSHMSRLVLLKNRYRKHIFPVIKTFCYIFTTQGSKAVLQIYFQIWHAACFGNWVWWSNEQEYFSKSSDPNVETPQTPKSLFWELFEC